METIYVISTALNILAKRTYVAAGDDLVLMLNNLHLIGTISGRQVEKLLNATEEDWRDGENEIFCGTYPFATELEEDEDNYVFVKRFENNAV